MELNEYTHTLLAVGSLLCAYLLGGHFRSREIIENIVGRTLENLEKSGLIRTRVDKYGEVDIIPISEIIKKATKDAIPK
tara:strand:- start:274 stop:510 length:237 start_codon:yes stop_codon:yes gene_type:complete